MENISLRPSKKLFTKVLIILLTISLFILLLGLILQITIPLGKGVTGGEVAVILWPIIIGTLLLKYIIAVPISILWINNLRYVIKSERVTVYKGILSKTEQNIPYKAVTDFMQYRSLYDRILGIGSIKIQTAGQSHNPAGYEGVLSGLTEYKDIMNELRARLKKYNQIGKTEEEIPAKIGENIMNEILKELKQIRQIIEKR